ncbi:MAG: DUF4406 domain-containing protein [Candidatus Sungiibacteriota bacterium]
MLNYVTQQDLEEIDEASTFEALRRTAFRILRRMPQPVGMVCGPITTGGVTVEENLAALAKGIDERIRGGKNIFIQLFFEAAMHRIKNTPYYRDGNHLLETFYQPLFKAGLIKTLYFLPNWRSSDGATWEHEQALRLNMEIAYL